MKYLRMFLFGSLGLILSLIFLSIFTLMTQFVFGLTTSLLGSLVGAHAILGYAGKDKIVDKDTKKITIIGTVYAFITSLIPYVFMFGFSSATDIFFILIGTLGGYEVSKIFIIQKISQQENVKEDIANKTIVKPTIKKLTVGNKVNIYLYKLSKLLKWYIIMTVIILILGHFFFPGFGVSWIILIGLIIYEIYKQKLYIITENDVNIILNKAN